MNESAVPLLRVRDWDGQYENNRSRELARTSWFPAPNDLSADSYAELVSHAEGAAHLGVWTGLLMVASRAKPRGQLVREDCRPHTAQSLALVMRIPKQLVENAIQRLLAIRLLEIVEDKPRKLRALRLQSNAVRPQDAAAKSQQGAVEGKGTEHHHQEGKGKEKKGTRTAPNGIEPPEMERACEESKTEDSSASGSAAAASSQKGDDADEHPGVGYASPDDELKAIYLDKAGESITIELLHAIRVNLELSGVGVGDFVVEVRRHTQNEWRNPPGFLRDLSKRFRAKTRPASVPVTAAEAAAKDYRCLLCHSRTAGEGAVPGEGGKPVPCVCASSEWISRQRARGVFEPEGTQ
jgi:hypothetical protein